MKLEEVVYISRNTLTMKRKNVWCCGKEKDAEDGWRIPDRSSFMTLQYRAFMWETDDNLMTQYTVYLVVPCYGIIARKNISFSLHYLPTNPSAFL